MADLRVVANVAAVTDSHGPPKKPSRKTAVPDAADLPPKPLPLLPEVPLHVRPVLSYTEIATLGILPERTLRRLVAVGAVKRAVLRTGRRVRFVVQDLLDELRQVGE